MSIKERSSVIGVVVMCCAIAACSSAPKDVEMLEQARFDYSEAAQNATIVKHAPQVLDQARDALQAADSRWKTKDEQWRVEHYAYLAKQRVETARLISQRAETDKEIEAMVLDKRNLTIKQREAELKKVRQEANDLKRQMAALQAEQTDRGMVLTLGDVLFDVGEASLAPLAARNIARISAFMRNYPERTARIEGHTDSVGDEQFNRTLSQERALAVRDALVDTGVDASRMSIRGFGEAKPVADNDTVMGRQSNRRVEIVFPDGNATISEFDDY